MSNEKKYTQEEMKAIVDEVLRKANLNPDRELRADEMENVSGGGYCTYVVPKTHEEIDKLWDVVEAVKQKYGQDIAFITAQELKVYAGVSAYNFVDFGTEVYRRRMHDDLDGKLNLDGLDAWSAH